MNFIQQVFLSTNLLLKIEFDNPSQEVNGFTKVFIIIGALMFAKQLPKLISDLTGIKLDGKFEWNPLKRVENEALGAKMVTGAAAGLITRGPAGMLSGAWSGLTKNKGFTDVRDAEAGRRRALRIARDNGSDFMGRTGMRVNNALGWDNEIDRIEREENRLANEINKINEEQSTKRLKMEHNKEIESALGEEKSHALKNIETGKAGVLSLELNQRKAHIENLKAQMSAYQQQANDFTLSDSQRDAASLAAEAMEKTIADAEADNGYWLNKVAVFEYIDKVNKNELDNGRGGKVDADEELAQKMTHTDKLVEVYLGNDDGARVHAMNGSQRKKYADELSSENRKINTEFIDSNAKKSALERQSKDIKERKRIAQANMNAVRAQKK